MADTIFKIPKLKGSSNYDIWAIRIEAILVKEGYLNLITRDITTFTLEEQARLEDSAYKATSLIKLSLEDGPLLQTRFINNPYELWINLKNLYETKGFSSEFILFKELINTTLNTYKGNLELYLNNFKKVVNSLRAKSILLPNKFLVALLLNNLNKDYEYIVAIIIQTIRTEDNQDIDLDSIISQLLDKSRRLNSIKSKNYSYIAPNYNNINRKNNSQEDTEMSMQTNIKNIKLPNSIKTITCKFCNKKGHLEEKCWKKNPKKGINNSTNKNNTSINTSMKESTPYQILSSKYNKPIEFILDSGATIHTCYIKELFIKSSIIVEI